MIDIAIAIIEFACVLAFVLLNVLILVWLERRVSAFFQERVGPNRIGPFGLLQTMNDTVKLLGKEAIIPKCVDKTLFKIAPIAIFIISILLYAVLPFAKNLAVLNINLGLFYFISISSTTTIAILMAGWSSNNKYSLLGGMRSVAQIISYEIPLVLSMISIVMLSGSLDLSEIVHAQKNYYFILLQPLSFIIFIISATAELNRGPFDIPEAEQEIVAGYHTEYSGMRFALFFLSEFANLFSFSAIITTLFLGGWQGPFLPPFLWFILKVYFVILIFMWIRWTFPRIRVDHMMKFNWKYLLPLSLINILLTGVAIIIFNHFKMIGG